MKTSPVLKVSVVAMFLLLLGGYVAYSSGVFEGKHAAASKNNNEMQVDSPEVKSTHPENIEIIPSTKSAPVFKPEYLTPQKDTSKKKNPKTQQQKNTNSNTGGTIQPNQTVNPSNQTVKPVIIPSSKSGRIFVPQKPDTAKNPK